jgi:hypothetical protein
MDEKRGFDAPVDTLKQDVAHKEFMVVDEDGNDNLDYSGAPKKIDPAEARLVHKLDKWIMPTLWSMYWLNYLDSVLSFPWISLRKACENIQADLV